MQISLRIYCLDQSNMALSAHSGMKPLAAALGAEVFTYRPRFPGLKRRSWRLGRWLERGAELYYGSAWNQWVPILDEARLSQAINHSGRKYDVGLFLWGEFATPSLMRLFRKRAEMLVGVFHCSQRRQWRVTMKPRWYMGYDRIVMMSGAQRDYFVDNGYPEDRLSVILHGVDTDFFYPAEIPERKNGAIFDLLLVGSTERDHAFAARVLRRLEGIARCRVLTNESCWHFYKDLINVQHVKRISDDELVAMYQKSDLLFMPMLDCTANNAILESMACGTPVMVNCVGGVSEYVNADCNVVMIGKKEDEWVDMIKHLAQNLDRLRTMRSGVRSWAGQFDWRIIGLRYLDLFGKARV